MSILLKPAITEKSMYLASQGVYTFMVERAATKHQIAGAVEALFGVHVVRVTTTNVHTADTSTGRRRIKKTFPIRKFARVAVKKGESIALFDLKEQGAEK